MLCICALNREKSFFNRKYQNLAIIILKKFRYLDNNINKKCPNNTGTVTFTSKAEIFAQLFSTNFNLDLSERILPTHPFSVSSLPDTEILNNVFSGLNTLKCYGPD